MSRDLTKMNLISIVQQLPKDDIEVIQRYIEMIENENHQLKSSLDEIRDYIDKKIWYTITGDEVCFEKILCIFDKDLDYLFQLLDKVSVYD